MWSEKGGEVVRGGVRHRKRRQSYNLFGWFHAGRLRNAKDFLYNCNQNLCRGVPNRVTDETYKRVREEMN